MDRREAVRLLAALAAALGAGTLPASGAAPCPPWLGPDALEGAKQMGQAFLTGNRNDADVAEVWALLQKDTADTPGRLETLVRQVHEDYERGRIEHLAGWYVSRTEARVFAAIATYCT